MCFIHTRKILGFYISVVNSSRSNVLKEGWDPINAFVLSQTNSPSLNLFFQGFQVIYFFREVKLHEVLAHDFIKRVKWDYVCGRG